MSTGQTPAVEVRSSASAQAVHITFWFVCLLVLLSACRWAATNVIRIPAGSRAAVLRFGAFKRVQDAGLLIGLPPPFEHVILFPGTTRVLEASIDGLERDLRARRADADRRTAMAADPEADAALLSDALAGSGYVLTGNAAIVHLSAHVFYRVTDPQAYILLGDRLPAALDRLATAAAIKVSASRDLDGLLVARPELAGAEHAASQRESLPFDLAEAMQERLNGLREAGTPLGIQVARVDIQASFPDAAVDAFNAVLSSLQTADRTIADARTAAENVRQGAQQQAGQIVRDAQARASERIATASAETAEVPGPEVLAGDRGLVERVYRERVEAIFGKVAHVTAIDANDPSGVIIPGKVQ
jgi:regulator of protease activity HflC (stomatin/prohibitin superfamily)